MHNEVVKSDIHSTDAFGFSELVFAVSPPVGLFLRAALFSDEKLRDSVGIRPPKLTPLKGSKIWGLPNRVMCFSHQDL
jgi:hypothetical protein